MRTNGRRALRALALLTAGLVLAGCASIPSTGPVTSGERISRKTQDFTLDYIPQGPAKGASPGEILRGFVEAASSPQGDYEVARKYLTTRLQQSWDADASVTIDDGRSYKQLGDGSWQLSVTPLAEIDDTGAYRESASSKPITLRYTLKKNSAGQWRISQAPDGVVLDEPTFRTVFTSRALYFFDPRFEYLVPDLRWFPARVSTPTRVVKALLAGPSKWLGQGALATAFPQGTKLTVDAVPTDDGTAEVDLNDAATGANRLTLERMKYQLQRSLLDGVAVGSVRISINGRVQQNIPDLSGAHLPISDPQVDPRPLVERAGVFGFASGTTTTRLTGISAEVARLHPSAVTISADQQTAAVLSAGGVDVVSARTGAPRRVDARSGLIAPALGPDGDVWTVPGAHPDALIATSPSGERTKVGVSWTGVDAIRSLQLSRDGTRVVAVLAAGSRTSLVVAAVIRGKDGRPVRLGQPLELPAGTGSILSATWVDQLTVASLSRTTSGAHYRTQVTTQQIGGQSSSTGGPDDGRVIVGGSGSPSTWVLTTGGSLQASNGTGWQERATKVSVLATQQGAPH